MHYNVITMKLWQSEVCFLILLTVKNNVTSLNLKVQEMTDSTTNYKGFSVANATVSKINDVKSQRKMLIPAYMRLQSNRIPSSKELDITTNEASTELSRHTNRNPSEVVEDITTPSVTSVTEIVSS